MNTSIKGVVLLTFLLITAQKSFGQARIKVVNEGITMSDLGNDTPEPTAILDINSLKGVLLPRLTTGERDLLTNPAEGLLIYNRNKRVYEFWNGETWIEMGLSDPVPEPETPSGLTASVMSSSQIDLSWTDNGENETGFEIWRSTTDGSGYEKIFTTDANVVSYSDTLGLDQTTTYYYQIRAVNDILQSFYAPAVNGTTALELNWVTDINTSEESLFIDFTGLTGTRFTLDDGTVIEASSINTTDPQYDGTDKNIKIEIFDFINSASFTTGNVTSNTIGSGLKGVLDLSNIKLNSFKAEDIPGVTAILLNPDNDVLSNVVVKPDGSSPPTSNLDLDLSSQSYARLDLQGIRSVNLPTNNSATCNQFSLIEISGQGQLDLSNQNLNGSFLWMDDIQLTGNLTFPNSGSFDLIKVYDVKGNSSPVDLSTINLNENGQFQWDGNDLGDITFPTFTNRLYSFFIRSSPNITIATINDLNTKLTEPPTSNFDISWCHNIDGAIDFSNMIGSTNGFIQVVGNKITSFDFSNVASCVNFYAFSNPQLQSFNLPGVITGNNFWGKSMPLLNNKVYPIGSVIRTKNIYLDYMQMSTSDIDGNINNLYTYKMNMPGGTKTLDMSDNGSSAATGTYQAPSGFVLGSNDGTPASPMEKAYVLVNNYDFKIILPDGAAGDVTYQ